MDNQKQYTEKEIVVMFWKLEIVAFIVFVIASATVFANGCIDVRAPEKIHRFDLDAGSHSGELAMDFNTTIPDEHIQKTEYIVMEEMRFDVNLADIHQ